MSVDALRALIEDPDRAAVLLDYDGSLAPIVDHPDDAVPSPGAVELLHRLVARFGRVAIVSGRPVGFLRRAVPVDGLEFVGQYGIERWVGGVVVVDAQVAGFTDRIDTVANAAERDLSGVLVERKGRVAVTLHWRGTPALGDLALTWAARMAEVHGLIAHPTKMAVELRPPLAIDKGTAVAGLLAGTHAAVFAGDDHGDLAAFDALDDMQSSGMLDHAVRIAVLSTEAPPELVARADVVVDGPDGLVCLLNELADAVSARG